MLWTDATTLPVPSGRYEVVVEPDRSFRFLSEEPPIGLDYDLTVVGCHEDSVETGPAVHVRAPRYDDTTEIRWSGVSRADRYETEALAVALQTAAEIARELDEKAAR